MAGFQSLFRRVPEVSLDVMQSEHEVATTPATTTAAQRTAGDHAAATAAREA